jgi:hypothetical protein
MEMKLWDTSRPAGGIGMKEKTCRRELQEGGYKQL